MRTRSGSALQPRARGRILFAGFGLALLAVAARGVAQRHPDADQGAAEEQWVFSPAPTVAYPGKAITTDARAWANTAALYDEPPDPAHCVAGVLRPQTRHRFLDAFNALRARHGLAPVRYNEAADRAAGEAALIMARNNALSHEPPSDWACWTAAGAAAAGSSNLLGGVSSPYLTYEDDNAILAEWLIEGDGDEIGHRRWMLDPYLDQTTLGRVITVLPGGVRVDSVVMKVFDFPGDDPFENTALPVPEFVAWPQGDYPRQFFSPQARLSFSISTAPDALTNVDFSQAVVVISDGQNRLPVRDQRWDTEGYGVANCLSWRVAGILPGREYSVTIAGIRGASRAQYSYKFRIMPAN